MTDRTGAYGAMWFWLVLFGGMGAVFGISVFTFFYAKGYSYFSNDPRACINCHVMNDVYDDWNHGSHKAFARCNDCHMPHDFAGKIIAKGINGWNHSTAFTTGNFDEPIRITAKNQDIVLKNCIYCHKGMISEINHKYSEQPLDCLSCHTDIGH